MRKKFTFLIAALMLLTMINLPEKAVGQSTTVASYLRSSGTNITSGGTFTNNLKVGSTDYLQDQGTSGTTYFLQILNNSAYWTTTPSEISFTAKLGGGSVGSLEGYEMYVALLDQSGNVISGTETVVADYISNKTGSDFSVTITPTNNVYGFKLYHLKKDSYNVRYYSCSLSYTPGSSSTPAINVASSLVVVPTAVNDAELAVSYSNLGTLTSGSVTLYDSNDQEINPAWFSAAFNNDYSKVIYTTTNNTTGAENSLRMHLAVSNGTNSATADVAVTQDFILTTMDQIFTRATANGNTAKEVTINFNNWVITGHNGGNSYATAQKAWLTDGTKGCAVFGNTSTTYPQFQANDKLNGIITCNLQLYTSFAEITGVKKGMTGLSTTSDGEVTPVTNQTITGLSAINTGSVVTLTNLTYSSSTQLLSDENSNTIKPVSQIYSSMSFTEGKTYNVTGVFETSSSNPTKRIYPRSDADIVEVVPANPTIYVSPTTLSSFTYVEGNGPSTAQSLTISGINLTANIGIALTDGNDSAFELSTDQSTWASSLTLTQASGTVNETTVYVRMKDDLDILGYDDDITFSSTGATSVTIEAVGTVTQPCVTWNLATNSYVSNPAPTEDLIQWNSDYVTMKNEKGTGTKVNNYIPPTQNSTRFYNGNNLTITPATGYAITSVLFTATTSGYANALANSTWTNATASAYTTSTPYTVTVTPTNGAEDIEASIGGTCGFTEVKIYYETVAVAPTWSTLPTPTINTSSNYMLDLSDFVTGSPTPTITLKSTNAASGYVFDADVLDFTPAANGTYTFTFTANNSAGSVNATLTITVATVYTILYSVNGADGGEASVVAGNAIGTLPVPTENIPTGFTFFGWMESPTHPYYNATTAPTMVTDATVPSSDMMLDAVFCIGETAQGTWTLSNSAPVAGDQVILAVEDGGNYYAMFASEDALTSTSFTVSSNVITGTVPSSWAVEEGSYTTGGNTTTGLSFFSGQYKDVQGTPTKMYLHLNSSVGKIATGLNNGIFEFGENNILHGKVTSRYLAFDNGVFSVDPDEADADPLLIFKYTPGATTNKDYTTSVISHADGSYIAENAAETLYGIHYINGEVGALDDLTNSGKLIVNNGGALDLSIVEFTNATAANLVIEDGGQLITSNAVAATVKKQVKGFNDNEEGGWKMIASPLSGSNVFPSNLTTNGKIYKYDEPAHYWRYYTGEQAAAPFTQLANKVGYLYGNENDVTLEFAGTLVASNTEVTGDLSYTAANENLAGGKNLAGWNLVGNPFACNAYTNRAYYVTSYDSEEDSKTIFASYAAAQNQPIPPCTGILVKASATKEKVYFKNSSYEVASAANIGFVQMNLEQRVFNRGVSKSVRKDNAIVSFKEGDYLEKFVFNEDNAKLYIPQNGKDFAIVSAKAQGEMPVNFKASTDGEYTITVNPEGVEMNYLHLIDNMTGMDIDLLQTPSYTFDATTRDYESRFRLVFGANNVDGPSTGSGTFAYFNGSEWQVSNEGEATLQVIDMMGRIVSTETVNGNCNLNLNQNAGVYMLRLINSNGVKTQKVVVR